MSWLKHAFAVDPPGPALPTPAQQPIVDWVCREIARRGLTTPGLMMPAMSRPLNYVGAMTMHAFAPAIWAIASRASHENYNHFTQFMEQHGSIEYLCRRIEEIEAELTQREKEAKTQASTGAPSIDL